MKSIHSLRRSIVEYNKFIALPLVVVLTFVVGKVAEYVEDAIWARFALRQIEIPIIWVVGLGGAAALLFYFPYSIARRLADSSFSRLTSAQLTALRSIPRTGQLSIAMNQEDAATVTFDLKPGGFVYEDDDGVVFLSPEYRMFLRKKGWPFPL